MSFFRTDPREIAIQNNITVIDDNNNVLKKSEDGMISNEGGTIKIYVNQNSSIERQRFTIAHELGHYMCGHLNSINRMFRDGSKNYSRNNFDFQEYEANNYAAELLMPKEKVNFLIEHEKITSVDELASLFIVSYSAMTIRLKNLGWINNG